MKVERKNDLQMTVVVGEKQRRQEFEDRLNRYVEENIEWDRLNRYMKIESFDSYDLELIVNAYMEDVVSGIEHDLMIEEYCYDVDTKFSFRDGDLSLSVRVDNPNAFSVEPIEVRIFKKLARKKNF